MERQHPELEQILAAKERRRERLARLSFPQKIEALVKLQELAVPLVRMRGKSVRVWTNQTAKSSAPNK